MASILGSILFYLAVTAAVLIMVLYVIPVVAAFSLTGGSTFVPTSKGKIETVLDLIPMERGAVVMDLGCGDGRFLLAAERRYGVEAVGYEINVTAYLLARLNILRHRARARVHLKNFRNVDLGRADYVFCYLFPDALGGLKWKFDAELKPGCVVVSCDYPIEEWREPEVASYRANDKEEMIYIYRL
jgi:SAM-dependent methyltransferase